MKDQAALDRFFLEQGVDGLAVRASKGPTLSGEPLLRLSERLRMFRRALSKIDRRADARLVAAVLRASGIGKNELREREAVEAAVPLIRARLEKKYPDIFPLTIDIGWETEHGAASHRTSSRVPARPRARSSSTGRSSSRPSTRSSTRSSRTCARSARRRTSRRPRPSGKAAAPTRGGRGGRDGHGRDRARGLRRALGVHRLARPQGLAHPALQGSRRDEPGAALGDDARSRTRA